MINIVARTGSAYRLAPSGVKTWTGWDEHVVSKSICEKNLNGNSFFSTI